MKIRLRIGFGSAHQLLDQTEEVRPEPGHAGELGAVGDLVQRHPQSELARAGSRGASRARGCWDPRSRRGPGRRDPPPRGPAGRTGRAPGSTSSRAARPAPPRRSCPTVRPQDPIAASSSRTQHRTQQALVRRQVGAHPVVAVHDPGSGLTGRRGEAGLGLDVDLGPLGQLARSHGPCPLRGTTPRTGRCPTGARRPARPGPSRPCRSRPVDPRLSCRCSGSASWSPGRRRDRASDATARMAPAAIGTASQKCQTLSASSMVAQCRSAAHGGNSRHVPDPDGRRGSGGPALWGSPVVVLCRVVVLPADPVPAVVTPTGSACAQTPAVAAPRCAAHGRSSVVGRPSGPFLRLDDSSSEATTGPRGNAPGQIRPVRGADPQERARAGSSEPVHPAGPRRAKNGYAASSSTRPVRSHGTGDDRHRRLRPHVPQWCRHHHRRLGRRRRATWAPGTSWAA